MATKEATIKRVHEDPRTGFRSAAETLKAARVLDRSVTREDVAAFFEGLRVKEERPDRRYNSFVAPTAGYQLHLDLADMSRFGGQPQFALVGVGAFSKMLSVVPVAGRRGGPMSRALDRLFGELGVPAQVFMDLGGEFGGEFLARLKHYDVQPITTRNHAAMAESAIRTLKEGIRDRQASLGRRGGWTRWLKDLVEGYNERPHTRTKMAPVEAASPENQSEAHARLESRAKAEVARPELEVGDAVRLLQKPALGGRSGYGVHESAWNARTYRVTGVERTGTADLYSLEGHPAKVLRRDLKKADPRAAPTRLGVPRLRQGLVGHAGRNARREARVPVPL